MISVKEAQARIFHHTQIMPLQELPLEQAASHVLGEDIIAKINHPPSDVSAMDGYAFAEKPIGSFEITGEIAAGDKKTNAKIGAKECWLVFTGANVTGAAYVIPQELIEREDEDHITIPAETEIKESFIRKKGSDFHQGEKLLKKGNLLSSRDIGLAASANYKKLTIVKKPKAILIATGNELSLPGQAGTGGLVASSLFGLQAFLNAQGARALSGGIIKDDPKKIAETLMRHIKHYDVIITTGGVSVGKHDYLPEALERCGISPIFHNVAMRPGKPTLFAKKENCHIFSLPGNPVSSFVVAMTLILPCIRKMLTLTPTLLPHENLTLACDLPANGPRTHYMRACYHNKRESVMPFQSQDSAMIKLLSQADGLLIRPPHAKIALKNDIVSFIPFPQSFTPI